MLRKFTLTLAFSALTVFFVGCGDDKFEHKAGRMDGEALKVVKEKYPEGITYKTFGVLGKDKGKGITVKHKEEKAFGKREYYYYTFTIKDKDGKILDEALYLTCDVKNEKKQRVRR